MKRIKVRHCNVTISDAVKTRSALASIVFRMTTALRKIRDADDARACWAAAQASGLDARAWARAHGVDGRSLNTWRMNLGLGGAPRRALRSQAKPSRARAQFVELVTAPTPVAPRGRYLVRVGIAEVEFDDAFREETLRRLVSVLRSC
jgi:hypothetical protein